MAKGISNFQTENAFKKIDDEDINDNFVGVFSSNDMNKLINNAAMISEKKTKGKYPFTIVKTDSSEKGRTHWWSILDIEPKQDIFFFDSFGLDGLKHFIMQDDQDIIEKVLFGTEKMTKTDSKIPLLNIRFNFNNYDNLTKMSLMPLAKQLLISFVLFEFSATSSNYLILQIYGW